jgi:hypothetical protein
MLLHRALPPLALRKLQTRPMEDPVRLLPGARQPAHDQARTTGVQATNQPTNPPCMPLLFRSGPGRRPGYQGRERDGGVKALVETAAEMRYLYSWVEPRRAEVVGLLEVP